MTFDLYTVLLFCILVFALILVSRISFAESINISGFSTYRDPLYNFSIKYPSNWSKILNNSTNEIVTFRHYPISEISLTTTKLKNTSLEKMAENQIKTNKILLHNFALNQYNYSYIKFKITSLVVIFTYDPFYEQDHYKVQQVWFADKHNVYSITYKAKQHNFDKDRQLFEDIINSFESPN